MGHVSLECGTGEFSEDDLQYGEWMLAYTETWKARTPRVRPAMDHSKSRGREDWLTEAERQNAVEAEAVVFGLEHRVEACGRKRTRMKIVRVS
jgi:hypothetical protein